MCENRVGDVTWVCIGLTKSLSITAVLADRRGQVDQSKTLLRRDTYIYLQSISSQLRPRSNARGN